MKCGTIFTNSMRKSIIYIIFIFCGVSCRLDRTFDEKKVIQDLFLELIYIEEIHIPPLPDSLNNELTKKRISEKNLSIKSEYDSLKTLVLDDTLRRIELSDAAIILGLIKQNNCSNEEQILVNDLFAKKTERKLNVAELKKQNGFNIITMSNSLAKNKTDGYITFSSIVYNKEINLGCFYYDFLCGRRCGSSNVIFFKESDGRYIVEKTILISLN